MPSIVARLAALVLGLVGPPGPAAGRPARAEVVVESLDVFDERDERSLATGSLGKGDRVFVLEVDRDGWATIEPPPGSFCWIEQAAILEGTGGTGARVVAARAQVRSGNPEARMPGVPRGTLAQGDVVRLLDRPPLIVGRGRSAKVWRAIAPPRDEVRLVRAEGIEWVAEPPPEPPREALAAYAPNAASDSNAAIPPAIAAEIAQIESSHRAVLREPISRWRLDSIQQRYQQLLKRVTDPASGGSIRARLALVARQQDAAEAARTIEAILERSRRRDQKLALYLRRIAQAGRPRERPYDAVGLVQPSSRKVDGQKVFALIGADGKTSAYLDLPAGLDATSLVTRHVGVRGRVHYDANLRARLISVQDLDPIDEDR